MFLTPRGNLVINGDFELGTVGGPPLDWTSENVLIVGATLAFTGVQAASMGAVTATDPAFMYQDIDAVPGQRYLLTFQVGTTAATAGDLAVSVTWFSSGGVPMGTGFYAFISGLPSAIPTAGFWAAYSYVTDVAPFGASLMRLTFTRSPSATGTNPTIIDAVTLAEI